MICLKTGLSLTKNDSREESWIRTKAAMARGATLSDFGRGRSDFGRNHPDSGCDRPGRIRGRRETGPEG